VAVDSAGNLFIADASNLRVRKVSSEGIITTVAGNGNAPPCPRAVSNGTPATGTPILPVHVAVDGAGNLFIAEGPYAEVRKVSPDGIISTVLSPTAGSPYFGFISASTVDRTGNLFVAGSMCDDDDNCLLAGDPQDYRRRHYHGDRHFEFHQRSVRQRCRRWRARHQGATGIRLWPCG
jgi:hypothetical protein